MSANDRIRRSLNPGQVHLLWHRLIEQSIKLDRTKQVSIPKQTLLAVLNECSSKNESKDSVDNSKLYSETLVEQAIKDELVCADNPAQNEDTDNGETLIRLPQQTFDLPDHDWFCFECHNKTKEPNEPLIECQTCWRVYHTTCVQNVSKFCLKISADENDSTSSSLCNDGDNFVCPICVATKLYTPYHIGSRKLSQEDFNQTLGYTYTRLKAKSSLVSHSLLKLKQSLNVVSLNDRLDSTPLVQPNVSTNSETNSNSETSINIKEITKQLSSYYLAYKLIDLDVIEKKLDNFLYKSIGEFLSDCLLLKHMFEVVIGSCAEQSPIIRRRLRDSFVRMLDAVRYDLKEMIGCVDCYRNSNRQNEDKLWFCRPCDPPHLLVFAKQKGYPYWPAKVIYPRLAADIDSCDQYDVRFFGSNHERSLIDKTNMKDINSSLSELSITKANPALERALSELRNHRDLLEGNNTDSRPNNSENSETDQQLDRSKRKYRKKSLSSQEENPASDYTETTDVEEEFSDKSKVNSAKKCKLDNKENCKDRKISKSKSTEMQSKDDENTETECESDNDEDDDGSSVGNQENEETTDIEESTLNDDSTSEDNSKDSLPKQSNSSQIESNENSNSSSVVKRKRGRPPKNASRLGVSMENTSKKVNTNRSLVSRKSRIRRKKVMYSPQSAGKYLAKVNNSTIVRSSLSDSTLPSTRGRRSKLFGSPTDKVSTPVSTGQTRSKRGSSSTSAAAAVVVKVVTPVKETSKSLANSISKDVKSPRPNIKSANTSPRTSKNAYRYQKRKSNLERQRQLLHARRLKLEQVENEFNHPKHIPPVTATKSAPVFSPVLAAAKTANQVMAPFRHPQHVSKASDVNRPILKPILNSTYQHSKSTADASTNGKNDSTTPNANTASYVYYTKSESDTMDAVTVINNDSELCNGQVQNMETFIPPSSVLKPLNGEEGEDSNDKKVNGEIDIELEKLKVNNGFNSDQILKHFDNNVDVEHSITVCEQNNVDTLRLKGNNYADEDDDDEEPYLYDDEQLEQQINDYLEYQKEKEQCENQQSQYYEQQQYLLQNLAHQRLHSRPPINGITTNINYHQSPSINNSASRQNGFIDTSGPIKKYIEYSPSSIYSPTKKNQRLVNAYLHHINTSNLPMAAQKNDYLAQLIIHKDEFDAECDQSLSPKKRGRPPKGSEKNGDTFERSSKAKCIVEKSYIQETACNRMCLTKNVKVFKRFREFVETQSRKELSKYKREIEDLKQQIYRLNNKNVELEKLIKHERDLSKRCDPEIVTQMEAKHQREISEIKRKQWCINCEAEAAYFCCFNTNYCSAQCQHKHWYSGHQSNCTRNRTNKNSKANQMLPNASTGASTTTTTIMVSASSSASNNTSKK